MCWVVVVRSINIIAINFQSLVFFICWRSNLVSLISIPRDWLLKLQMLRLLLFLRRDVSVLYQRGTRNTIVPTPV